MKSIPPMLLAHYREPVTRLATLFRIQHTDGVVLCLTEHDDDITFNGETYSPSYTATPSALTTGSDLSVDNSEVTGVPGGAVSLEDQLSGLYDGAEVRIWRVCYEHPEYGGELLKRGWLGTLSANPSDYRLELRGLMEALQKPVGVVLQPTCRAQLGSLLCGVDLLPHTRVCSVDAVTDLQRIACGDLTEADDYYIGSRVTFLSGVLQGMSYEVLHSTAEGLLVFAAPLPKLVSIGDEFSIYAGCDHTLSTCRDRFNNLRRFCAEPCINPDRTVNPAL